MMRNWREGGGRWKNVNAAGQGERKNGKHEIKLTLGVFYYLSFHHRLCILPFYGVIDISATPPHPFPIFRIPCMFSSSNSFAHHPIFSIPRRYSSATQSRFPSIKLHRHRPPSPFSSWTSPLTSFHHPPPPSSWASSSFLPPHASSPNASTAVPA